MSQSDLTKEQVENYLLDNKDYLEEWFSKHGNSEMVRRLRTTVMSTPKKTKKMIDYSPESRRSSNQVTSNMFRRYVEGNLTKIKQFTLISRESLKNLNESEIFMELIRDIATELDVNLLCHKILQNISILTRSDRGSLFLVRGTQNNKYLVSKLFDVTRTSTLLESIHNDETEIKVPFGVGIAGHVAQTKETVNIKEAYEDPRFNQAVDQKTGYRTHSILCMPILSYDDEVVGVAQIINKTDGNHEFSKADEEHFRKYLVFCGIGITNAQLFEMSVQEYKRNQLLLNLARGVFEEQTNMEKLIKTIMSQAQDLLKCARCCVYLLEELNNGARDILRPVYNRVVNGAKCNDQLRWVFKEFASDEQVIYQKPTCTKEVQIAQAFDMMSTEGCEVKTLSQEYLSTSKNAEIARQVVVVGMPLNIADMETEEIAVEGTFIEDDKFVTKSMLCMPIFNHSGRIIGVTQLINKHNRQPFNENDANIIEAFSIFTGLGIHNCQMYENACRLMAKQTVAFEVLSYHATAQADETDKLVKSKIPQGNDIMLYSYAFNDIPLPDIDTAKAVITMFQESNLIKTFKIPYEVLCRWVLSVKKNYRPVTYHNWRHAFNVMQTMFTMLYTGKLSSMFSDLTIFGLLVACLCHDLDHRGTNNAFQVKTLSPLAMLYSTSVMEHHHFDHCIMILNTEGNNIFQSLTPEDYRKVIKILEHAILSTDLALYFKKRGDFKAMVDAGETRFVETHKNEVLRAMMMTACDVAAICKPWEIQQEVAQLVANEFFEQGDIEKTQLGEKPIAMMDREKKDELPKMQVGFIDAICVPVYKMFSEMNQNLDPLYKGVMTNRQNWQQLAEEYEPSPKHGSGKQTNGTPLSHNKRNLSEDHQTVFASSKKKVTIVDPKTKVCTVL